MKKESENQQKSCIIRFHKNEDLDIFHEKFDKFKYFLKEKEIEK